MDKNEFLAVEVMGWYAVRQRPHPCNPIWYRSESTKIWMMRVFDWNPFENIEQAMMLLDSLDVDWSLQSESSEPKTYSVQLFTDPEYNYIIFYLADNKCEAICEAVLEARGYYESPELLDEKNN